MATPEIQQVQADKYLTTADTEKLRTRTREIAAADSLDGRRQGVVRWMLVDLALETGLRVSEIQRLTVGDFSAGRRTLRIERAKKDRPAVEHMPISKRLSEHLRMFIAWKGESDQDTGPEAPLFVGERGPIQCRGLQRIWTKACELADLEHPVSIHGARHTVAVRVLSQTRNLRHVQKKLGHADPRTTAAMYADVSFEEMQAAADNMYDD